MTIPAGITRDHVLAALDDITRSGVPKRRQATKFELVHDGHRYPPKFVISLAAFHATGRELQANEFSGGAESNDLLTKLGFTCIPINGSKSLAKIPVQKQISQQPTESSTMIGRIIITGRWQASYDAANGVLDAVCATWPSGKRVRYLTTCGGFLSYQWEPSDFPGDPQRSTDRDRKKLISWASQDLAEILTPKRRQRLAEIADVLTVGVDGFADDYPPHIELVAIVTLATGAVQWTGKTYPTPAQQRDLVRITDLRTHCFEHNGDRVLVLGCHDLNLFSPRSRANATGWRSDVISAMRQLSSEFQPTVVLQHPHTSDTPNLWRTGWDGLRKDLASVQHFAGSGRYDNGDTPCRGTLDKTLASTRSGSVCDIVVRGKAPHLTEIH